MRIHATSLVALLLVQAVALGQTPLGQRPIVAPGDPAPATSGEPPALDSAAPPGAVPADTPSTTATQTGAPPSADRFGTGWPDNASRFWASAEYVSWWVQGSKLPPLVTTSPAGTPLANAGVLGTPGATILLGDQSVNSEMRPGGRFTLGGWFDDAHTWGLEAGVMLIGGRNSSFFASSDGSQIIARPFVDATSGQEVAEIVSFPALVRGDVAVPSNSDPLVIADVALRNTLWGDCTRQVALLAGYRYLHFGESLQIQENLTSLDPLTQGTHFQLSDRFATRNDFNGGLLGLDATWTVGSCSLELFGKLAAGNLRREVTINGATVITSPATAPLVYPGGLLALPSNSGTFTSDRFACLPELGLTAGWQITPNLRATIGYSLLWLTEMVRPGDQIDRNVNPNLLPPPLPSTLMQPTFTLRDSDIWVQGVRVGLEYRY